MVTIGHFVCVIRTLVYVFILHALFTQQNALSLQQIVIDGIKLMLPIISSIFTKFS